MLLSMESVLRTVFLVYGAFWILVLLVLLVGVGGLLKRHDRLLAKSGHEPQGSHH